MSCGEFAEQSGSESSWGWQNKCARYSPRYLSTHHLQIPKFPGPFEFAASPIHWSLNRDKDDLSCIFTQVNIEYSWKHCQQFVWKWTQTYISKLRIIILVSEILDTNYHRVELRARRDIVWPECFKWWYMIFWLNCFDPKGIHFCLKSMVFDITMMIILVSVRTGCAIISEVQNINVTFV